MLKLKQFLLALIYSYVPEGEEEELPEGDDDLPEGEEEELPEGDDDLPEGEEEELPPEGKKPSRAQQRIIELSRQKKEAEEREQRLKSELDDARRGTQSPAVKTQDQVLWEQEEAIIRNPESNDWQRYSVQSARDARAARAEAAAARRESADAVDRTRFERFSETKPKLYEKYRGEVEKLRADNMPNVPREEIMALLIGRDVRDGKLKPAETKKPAPKRETPPGVRSDVRGGRGKMTDAEARAKRLENVRI